MTYTPYFMFHGRIVLLITALFLILISGCRKSNSLAHPFKWNAINREVDQLSQQLDSLFFIHAEDSEINPLIDSLERISKRIDNEELNKRVEVFRAEQMSGHEGGDEEYEKKITDLREHTDSATYPYLYHRILHLFPDSDDRNLDEYVRINNELDFFRSVGDPVMTASSLISLGNLLKDVRDPAQAIEVYEEADSILNANGFEEIALFNRMNIATASIILRDTVKATAILQDMRKNPIITDRPEILENVLHNLYIDCGVRDALDSLYAIKGEESSSLIETFMSNALMNEGDIPGAVVHARKAVDKALADENINDYAIALYAQSDALSAADDTLRAYRSLIKAVEITDDVGTSNEPDRIKKEETNRLMSLRMLEHELARSRWQLRIVCGIFILIVILAIGGFFLRKRIIRLKTNQLHANEEKDKIARKLVATQIAMNETHKVLSTVEKAVDGLMGDNNTTEHSREIANAIHTHKVRSSDRESFIDSFTEIHPDFVRRLKECNSAITEPDIRLASYIVTGMDNKQIASTMGIRPESVKQARWRLRTKLSLEKGASLEEALRKLMRGE